MKKIDLKKLNFDFTATLDYFSFGQSLKFCLISKKNNNCRKNNFLYKTSYTKLLKIFEISKTKFSNKQDISKTR